MKTLHLPRHQKALRTIGLFPLLFMIFVSNGYGEDNDAFLPTWKLLAPEAKEQFVAGYLQGWRDAEKVTEIATEYVKENPQKAVEGLEKIRSLYDMSAFKASAIANEIDNFYADPSNGGAGLAKAVSSAKQRLSR